MAGLGILLIWQVGGLRAEGLRGGWSEMSPYQNEVMHPSGPVVAGLDVEVMKLAAQRVGIRVEFERVSRPELREAVRNERLAFGLGVHPEELPGEGVWFSVPYRDETIALFCRESDAQSWRGTSALDSLRGFVEAGLRLAVAEGEYYGPDVAALRRDPAYSDQFVDVAGVDVALSMLIAGEADGFLADPRAAAGAAVAAGSAVVAMIERVPGVVYRKPVSMVFARGALTASGREEFDQALGEMITSGEVDRMIRQNLSPHLLAITRGTVWFRAFDAIGTIAFAISGLLIARRERYDVVGAVVLAALPAVGGGIMRDLISGRSPIAVMASPLPILLVLFTVAVGFAFFWAYDLVRKGNGTERAVAIDDGGLRWMSTRGALEVTDAIGLATFTVVGVMVALEQRCEPLWMWGPIIAGLTGAGGGVLRDVLRSQADIPTLKGSVYPEIAICWGAVYSGALIVGGADLTVKSVLILTAAVIVAGFVTRLLVVQFRVRGLFLGRAPLVVRG